MMLFLLCIRVCVIDFIGKKGGKGCCVGDSIKFFLIITITYQGV